MTDEQRPAEPGAGQGAAPRRIILTFPADGSTDCRIDPEGAVTAAHVYLAAWLLDAWAREVRMASLATPARGIVLADRLPPGGPRQ